MTGSAGPEGLADRLARGEALHLRAEVSHARRGPIRHAFRYGADFLLLAPEHLRPITLLSRNRWNLWSFHDSDHGGPRGAGRGAAWAWEQLAEAGLDRRPGQVLALLTQPRLLGHWFVPVSFWMVLDGDQLIAAIAEVNNTFGQRHSYLCHQPDFAPMAAGTAVAATKVFHVSPFQDIAGGYRFNFSLHPDRLAIRILQHAGEEGLDAAMAGRMTGMTNRGLLAAALRRPGGSLRMLALIYWHALRLKAKGAAYRPLPPVPVEEISR